MDTQAQKLIEAVNNGESVRIIRGDVDGMKILEWIEKNIEESWGWADGKKAKPAKGVFRADREVISIGFGKEYELGSNTVCSDVTYDHTFQASDILNDYERIGDKFERDGEWWQEVKPGQVIEGEVRCLITDNIIPSGWNFRKNEISAIIPTTGDGYSWFGPSFWKHLALPTTAPEPKVTQVSKEDVFKILKEHFETDSVQIVEGE